MNSERNPLEALSDLIDAAVSTYDGQSEDFPELVGATERAAASYEKHRALYCAAPELLAASQNSLNVLAALATGQLSGIGRDSAAMQELRAAIAKATGEDVA